jgi:hypothetical protein
MAGAADNAAIAPAAAPQSSSPAVFHRFDWSVMIANPPPAKGGLHGRRLAAIHNRDRRHLQAGCTVCRLLVIEAIEPIVESAAGCAGRPFTKATDFPLGGSYTFAGVA